MTKKVLIPLALVIVFIGVLGFISRKYSSFAPTVMQTPQPSGQTSITIKGKSVALELAKTPQEKAKGLSDRSTLDAENGMLFIFGGESNAPIFWMKGMLIPLDIIWIKDGKIIKIDKNIQPPAPNTPDSSLKTYTAGVPTDYVLEVNAGFSDANNIKVGDGVKISGI